MNFTDYKILSLALLLSACSSVQRPVNSAAAKPVPPTNNVVTESEQEPQNLPHIALDEPMLYEFLLGDIAQQRGRPDLAATAYLDLAKTTRDPRVARRAALLAFESRQMDKSLAAFELWQEIEPTAKLPKQMLVSLLLGGGKLSEASSYVKSWLAAEPKNTGQVFIQLHSMVMLAPNKTAALDWLIQVAQPFPEVAEAHWAIAHVASETDKKELALAESRLAVQLRSDWDMPLVLEAQLLMPKEPEQALTLLSQFLAANPASKSVRLFYARALLEQKRFAESRGQFQQLLTADKDNAELAFAVALLSLQMGELDRAEKELKETLLRGKKDADIVHYYLAQLYEAKKNDAAALAEYRLIVAGEYVFSARLREAYLLNKAGKIDDACAVLKNAPLTNNQQRVTAVVVEAQILRDAKQFDASYKVLADALDKLPNQPQLLFEAAMAADKLGKLDLFEQTLRKLLQIVPEHAQANNALGYSFLDRNVKVEEGMKLVEKAYQLAPDDAAITDSVGWGYYRLGKIDKSVEFLRRAFTANPDPEIAAHLGEVLWVQGKKEEAVKFLQDTLKANPDSESLRAVIKKFVP
jgi:tetratricopeptide (TPR) repeat protein